MRICKYIAYVIYFLIFSVYIIEYYINRFNYESFDYNIVLKIEKILNDITVEENSNNLYYIVECHRKAIFIYCKFCINKFTL